MAFIQNRRQFARGLKKLLDAQLDEGRDELREGGQEIAEQAQLLAPLDEGDLEKADQTFKKTRSGAVHEIVFNKAYATFMHEADYKLGPKSQQKNAAVQSEFGPVGPKYLERPMDGLETEIRKALGKAVFP